MFPIHFSLEGSRECGEYGKKHSFEGFGMSPPSRRCRKGIPSHKTVEVNLAKRHTRKGTPGVRHMDISIQTYSYPESSLMSERS